jgi:hypothetical protein
VCLLAVCCRCLLLLSAAAAATENIKHKTPELKHTANPEKLLRTAVVCCRCLLLLSAAVVCCRCLLLLPAAVFFLFSRTLFYFYFLFFFDRRFHRTERDSHTFRVSFIPANFDSRCC